jgi:hypothetical protein
LLNRNFLFSIQLEILSRQLHIREGVTVGDRKLRMKDIPKGKSTDKEKAKD